MAMVLPAGTLERSPNAARRPSRLVYSKLTSRNSTAPETRPSARPDLKSSDGVSSTSNTLAPAARPCCSGTNESMSRLSGAVVMSIAVRKPMNSSERQRARSQSGAAPPTGCRRDASEAMNCTTGLLVARAAMSFMLLRRLCSLTFSKSAASCVLRVEHLDDALAVERFLDDARDVAHRCLDARAVAAERTRHLADQPRQRRRDQEHEQRPAAS